MCDECANFLQLIISYESRIINADTSHPKLRKGEVDIAYNYIQSWPQRQCMCCFRNAKNFERFNLVVQSMICLMVTQLKEIQTFLDKSTVGSGVKNILPESGGEDPAPSDAAKPSSDAASSSTKPEEKTEVEKGGSESAEIEEIFVLSDVERILIVISKAFLLNFPLYVAYKHSVHPRLDDLSANEVQTLGIYCDLHDNEIPVFLLRNVTLFCNGGGFHAMTFCFEQSHLPVSTAHAITAMLSNIKLWLNYHSILKLFFPLRIKILQYMCGLSDQELRSPATKSMAEFMWTAIKDPMDSQISFDTEGLTLAFKYFTSTTLTMRLSGIAQINAHINLFNEICTSETIAEVEVVGQKLADWLTENQIINHLFGPNLHVEVIKQSHIILNFLAVENQISEEHINLIWQSAQLKHCSKTVYDILPSLVKNLSPKPATHLYSLLCRLDTRDHTEQSIFIVSALTKLIWSWESCRQNIQNLEGILCGERLLRSSGLNLAPSTDNSLSMEGNNSDDDQPDEDSSEGQKSQAEVAESNSDFGPPCKQAKHKNCNEDTLGESEKPSEDDKDAKEALQLPSAVNRRMAMMIDNSSSEDCLNADFVVFRRKILKKKKKRQKEIELEKEKMREKHEVFEMMSEGDSLSDGAPISVTGADSDCSESENLQSAILDHLSVADKNLIDLLHGVEKDGSSYSSPTSNKSEKNMGDFDDEESHCEEELAQLAAGADCLGPFNIPRASVSRSLDDAKTEKQSEGVSFKYNEICEPGNTLLWDLLQDDKIGQLGEQLAFEAEKALGTLLCFNTDKYIRMKFIEACLLNLAEHKSVIVSLRLLPKLFSSFQQFRSTYTHYITIWAERQYKMMHYFFNNLKHYTNTTKLSREGSQSQQQQVVGLMYSHMTQVQVRLQFLTYIFGTLGSPDAFRLNLEQVDDLWAWLSNDPECADCLFAWLQGQAKGGVEQHALDIEALHHLYTKKLPELKPEGISMVALGLFQQLCSLARHYENQSDGPLDPIGMSFLWKIALKANNTDVSLTAIQYINSYYLGQQLKFEEDFIAQCMNHLTIASCDLTNPETQDQALMCLQRALMLLNTHLETFRRKYAYHLRRWQIEGKNFANSNALRNDNQGSPIRIIIQPAGVPDKSILQLHSTDLIGDLKAEIAKWWEALQTGIKNSGVVGPVLGLLFNEGPLRIITQGQEISSDYDERSLADMNFKDNQIVYISFGGRNAKRKDMGVDQLANYPSPPQHCIPTILLLQPIYFEQLFQLTRILGEMKIQPKNGPAQPHTKAQLLSRRVWDILAMLPTNPTILSKFRHLNGGIVEREEDEVEVDCDATLNELLDHKNLQKFMYSLHIIESFSKSKLASTYLSSFSELNQIKSIQKKLETIEQLKQSISILQANQMRNSKVKPKSQVNDNHHPEETEKEVNTAESEENIDVQSVTEGSNESKEKNSSPKKVVPKPEKPVQEHVHTSWVDGFIKCGGLKRLYQIFMDGVFQRSDAEFYNEWKHDCLANLLRVLCIIGLEDIKIDENFLKVPKINEKMLEIMPVRDTLNRLSSILFDASQPLHQNHFKTGFWGRAQVVQFTMNLLVCFVHSSAQARQILWDETDNFAWLQRLILNEPEPAVRREACAGLYRICLGNMKVYFEITVPLLKKLISFLPLAENMKSQGHDPEDGKEPYGPACRDYFWLLCRLVDTLTCDMIKNSLINEPSPAIDVEGLCRRVSDAIVMRGFQEIRNCHQDDGLVGLINLMGNLLKFDPPFKFSGEGKVLIERVFECLFDLPSAENRDKPKCKSQSARAAAYDLLVELCKNSPDNYVILHGRLMTQHCPGTHTPYPWDYWPRDDGRSECGYVGLTNLGATCYLASCIQHLYMMPQARTAVLKIPPLNALKHATTLQELQRMFAYLMESERKAYNPRSFCRVYQMDHQPLNTGEQKDMAEFFIDLVSKMEEMSSELKALVKKLFCGILSNNVVSLDCGHVSRTIEEFYTVRCQVADMRNLYESLDEVTVKDTLEGDNMYTCSQCGKKVRAEKRACFKKLPQILCFNTMRYTFNMVTMLKEKVNTHFSFPMRLNMGDYVEKNLIPQYYEEEKQRQQNGEVEQEKETLPEKDNPDDYEYDLVGVTVHTGTADGGHYYSFIKERNQEKSPQKSGTQSERWFLFNDAEVKIFDPSQIAAECFGGEMTSKTYDSATEKYLDFSFEKTNSAYMLFYEKVKPQSPKAGTAASDEGEKQRGKQETEAGETAKVDKTDGEKEKSQENSAKAVENDAEVKTDDFSLDNSNTVNCRPKCDIDDKDSLLTLDSNVKPENESLRRDDKEVDTVEGGVKGEGEEEKEKQVNIKKSTPTKTSPEGCSKQSNQGGVQKRTLLSKDLEEWIWQDNKQFLQDRNIFEHTYFNFMWQICGQIPTTLMRQNISCMAAQLSVSFFIETFIHAKEKPTMVIWVELLTKQFNANEEACEWFLRHMSAEPWWPVQVLIQCPNQMVRQMFQRLVIHVIQRLRSSHHTLYLKTDVNEAGREVIGEASCVTRFIKSMIMLLENGAKAHLRHLSEFFGLLFEFSRMGEEEMLFLLRIGIIKSVSDFYLGHKHSDNVDSTSSDNDDNSSDEALSVDNTRPASLEKMIALVASLVERSRGQDMKLHLSARDFNAIAGGKGFPFLYQQIRDNINPHQTRHLIHALCRFDERLANQIITMLFSAVTKHTELCGPFFKLLSLLTESSVGPSGMPCFSQLVLQRVWDAAEYCPQSALDWLALQAPRNKIAHAWILQSAESWVEQFLLAHNNARVRHAAAYLLVSLVPSQAFRTNYRVNQNHKMVINAASFNANRDLGGDCQAIIHKILNLLLSMLRSAGVYTEIEHHGTTKLTAYFNLMSYLMVSKTEKLMLGPHMRELWELFHPRLSEPSVPAHYNKQALLSFWYHAASEPENVKIIVSIPDITRNIAFNYILADHEESEIVAYNRAMLPVYYGLLRICCQQSRSLTRQLAGHQNLQWAFKNITPHPTQYPTAVDELFRLMALFAARYPDCTEAEDKEITLFRRTTLTAYLSSLDARVSWGTLIAALRILVDNEEDRLFVVCHGGIAMAFEALQTLHSMYHEATACHVSGDLQELLSELVLLTRTLRLVHRSEEKKRLLPATMKGTQEGCRRLATLLNTYNPPEMRNLTLDVLKELVKYQTNDVILSLVPILTHCHTNAQNTVQMTSQLGIYFPKSGVKNIWSQTVTKTAPRPPRPMAQMSIPLSHVLPRGQRKEYDTALEEFYKPYHDFLDVMFRMAVNTNQMISEIVKLSCLTGMEAAYLHFSFFPKFWVGIYNNKQTNKYVELLLSCPLLLDYVTSVLKDVRSSLNDSIILSFMEIYLPKVIEKLNISQLLEYIFANLASVENVTGLCGDMLAVKVIIESVADLSTDSRELILNRIQELRTHFKKEEKTPDSPPVKRRKSDSESNVEEPDQAKKEPSPESSKNQLESKQKEVVAESSSTTPASKSEAVFPEKRESDDSVVNREDTELEIKTIFVMELERILQGIVSLLSKEKEQEKEPEKELNDEKKAAEEGSSTSKTPPPAGDSSKASPIEKP